MNAPSVSAARPRPDDALRPVKARPTSASTPAPRPDAIRNAPAASPSSPRAECNNAVPNHACALPGSAARALSSARRARDMKSSRSPGSVSVESARVRYRRPSAVQACAHRGSRVTARANAVSLLAMPRTGSAPGSAPPRVPSAVQVAGSALSTLSAPRRHRSALDRHEVFASCGDASPSAAHAPARSRHALAVLGSRWTPRAYARRARRAA